VQIRWAERFHRSSRDPGKRNCLGIWSSGSRVQHHTTQRIYRGGSPPWTASGLGLLSNCPCRHRRARHRLKRAMDRGARRVCSGRMAPGGWQQRVQRSSRDNKGPRTGCRDCRCAVAGAERGAAGRQIALVARAFGCVQRPARRRRMPRQLPSRCRRRRRRTGERGMPMDGWMDGC
jgi:hypothetical protein